MFCNAWELLSFQLSMFSDQRQAYLVFRATFYRACLRRFIRLLVRISKAGLLSVGRYKEEASFNLALPSTGTTL